ncbi:hypothetical protein ACFSO7_21275 [Bacillus sp. CGMCC 1.16607]|uniref:hypothetical protein n=1 Tax=Bacillus sp. CGMCC 1.16607 TaxID=3351842 RepID=UPI003634DAE5
MKIIDTASFFIDYYQPSLSFLSNYYNEFPEAFKEYFAYHCKDTEERHIQSINKYTEYLSTIKQVHKNIVSIINEITDEYLKLYELEFPIEVNLIVGGFGSNAFTHRQIIPNITFALERLSPEMDHLKTIVAHEFGHAAHNILSNKANVEWAKIQWENPLTWLYQEGAATHFSRNIVGGLNPSIYFSFNNDGEEWLAFSELNRNEIKMAFAEDYSTKSNEFIFREWFSIYGGEKYGYNRLGYFIGDMFFQDQISKFGEINAILAWKSNNFEEKARKWLFEENRQ